VSIVANGLDAAAEAYVEELTRRLRETLGDGLVGVWLIGSGARDDYLPGRSDIDVAVAVSRPLTAAEKERVVERCRHEALTCPAKGLELVVYVPDRAPGYELNLNGGPVVPFHVSYRAGEDAPHWFVVDLAASRDCARTLIGPTFADVFPELGAETVHAALRELLDWQVRIELTAPNTVLNACRIWRFAAEGVWSSKTDAATWAREVDPELIDAALAGRTGANATRVQPDRVRALLRQAREALG
jgi:hypothetical protein